MGDNSKGGDDSSVISNLSLFLAVTRLQLHKER